MNNNIRVARKITRRNIVQFDRSGDCVSERTGLHVRMAQNHDTSNVSATGIKRGRTYDFYYGMVWFASCFMLLRVFVLGSRTP